MRKVKALLVSAPWANYQSPSLPICHLAAFARQRGHDVDVSHLYLETAARLGLEAYDEIVASGIVGEQIGASLLFPSPHATPTKAPRLSPQLFQLTRKTGTILKSLCRSVAWGRYDLVGFSVNYQQLFPSLFIADWIKSRFPHIRILFGGRLVASPLGESLLRHFPQVDWCVDGEGEVPFEAILRGLADNREIEKTTPGLMFRSSDDIVSLPRTHLPSYLHLPQPDYAEYFDLLQTHPLLKHRNILPHIAIIESAGCRYGCAFCSDKSFWGSYRQAPAKRIATSLQSMVDAYGTTSFIFVSQMVEPKRCRSLFRHIASLGMDLCLICETRADIAKEHLREMKRAGVTEVQIGIEALSTPLLRKMRKGTRLIENLQAMKWCQELGLPMTSNLLLAFPTETQDDVDRTLNAIDYACSFMPPSRFVHFQLRQGCPVERDPKAYGVSSIRNTRQLTRFFSRNLARSLNLWHKDFVTRHRKRRYRHLIERYERWKKNYFEAQSFGRPLLFYLDCSPVLSIEDTRAATTTIELRD